MNAEPPASTPTLLFPEEKVFLALHNAQRRHLLKRLAQAPAGLTAGEAGQGNFKQRNLLLKHLTTLTELGLLIATTDPSDARCLRYRLAPWITLRRAERDCELDFGCAVLRWPAGSESAAYPRPLYRHRRSR
jgi:hypothetical protein